MHSIVVRKSAAIQSAPIARCFSASLCISRFVIRQILRLLWEKTKQLETRFGKMGNKQISGVDWWHLIWNSVSRWWRRIQSPAFKSGGGSNLSPWISHHPCRHQQKHSLRHQRHPWKLWKSVLLWNNPYVYLARNMI